MVDAIQAIGAIENEIHAMPLVDLENALQEQIDDINERIKPKSPILKLNVDFNLLKQRYPHLLDLINYFERINLLSSLRDDEGFILPTPIILVGDPGTGKTDFALHIANNSKITSAVLDLSACTAGFEITGSSSTWRGAKPGLIYNILTENFCQNPFVIFDEIDKTSHSEHSPILPAIGNLLEKNSARYFKDEFKRISIDASNINFVCTANSINGIPEHILDRCQIINCPAPTPAQKKIVIQSIWTELKTQLNAIEITLHAEAIAIISNNEISFREIKKILTQSIAFCLQRNSNVINDADVENSFLFCNCKADRKIGFIHV